MEESYWHSLLFKDIVHRLRGSPNWVRLTLRRKQSLLPKRRVLKYLQEL